jgi:hypothetical protein
MRCVTARAVRRPLLTQRGALDVVARHGLRERRSARAPPYAAGCDCGAFRENEIDETVLPDLTADLKELGVTAPPSHGDVLRLSGLNGTIGTHCVAETVQRLGGFVAKYTGDGVLKASETAGQRSRRAPVNQGRH